MSYILLTLRFKSVGISNPNRDVRNGNTGSKVEVVKGAIGLFSCHDISSLLNGYFSKKAAVKVFNR
jgi:hypothetical protein